jgi:hypothetical protein
VAGEVRALMETMEKKKKAAGVLFPSCFVDRCQKGAHKWKHFLLGPVPCLLVRIRWKIGPDLRSGRLIQNTVTEMTMGCL